MLERPGLPRLRGVVQTADRQGDHRHGHRGARSRRSGDGGQPHRRHASRPRSPRARRTSYEDPSFEHRQRRSCSTTSPMLAVSCGDSSLDAARLLHDAAMEASKTDAKRHHPWSTLSRLRASGSNRQASEALRAPREGPHGPRPGARGFLPEGPPPARGPAPPAS